METINKVKSILEHVYELRRKERKLWKASRPYFQAYTESNSAEDYKAYCDKFDAWQPAYEAFRKAERELYRAVRAAAERLGYKIGNDWNHYCHAQSITENFIYCTENGYELSLFEGFIKA